MTTHGDFLTRRKRLSDLAGGYKYSAILCTANELGVFSALSDGPKRLAALANELDLSEHGLELLLKSLVGLDLLAMEDDLYSLHGDAQEFLRDGAPHYQGDSLRHAYRLYQRWASLGEAVRKGSTPFSEGARASRTEADWRAFILAMDNISRTSAIETSDALDLTGVTRILDVGGGPGTYLYTFLQRLPEAKGVLLDFERVIKIAGEVVERFDVKERVDTIAGDMFDVEFDGPYDLVFLGNIIHSNSPQECRELVKHCAGELDPGGRLVIKDFFLDDTGTRPADGAVFALNMLVGTTGGRSYTWTETGAWMEEAGLEVVQKLPIATHSGLLVGRKS